MHEATSPSTMRARGAGVQACSRSSSSYAQLEACLRGGTSTNKDSRSGGRKYPPLGGSRRSFPSSGCATALFLGGAGHGGTTGMRQPSLLGVSHPCSSSAADAPPTRPISASISSSPRRKPKQDLNVESYARTENRASNHAEQGEEVGLI
ncbi:hypothetical protein GUJ93_ZPchr0003g18349 [Zizania palustris]|uniref:Uncharacterized protein n=1 Tax=Zizania palustris TaxID=103762 RepID=A0A8J5STA2_ZIZPA|nr:hypothetical protein GUJ93_ZPchr0003g18349 [Zizania palustris]